MTTETLTRKVTGISLPATQFRVYETEQTIDVDKVFEVLQGKLAAYRIRHFLTPGTCQQIVNNFWSSKAKVPRLGYGEEGVEGYFLGASHIEKTTQEYLAEASKFAPAVDELFANTINPAAAFRAEIANKKKITVRPAELNGMLAGSAKAVYWSSLGDFLLQPHDDFAQLRDPRQHGFEIQQANRVMAFNFYAEAPVNAGQLKVWNIEPDDETRAALGLTYSGFPYPPEVLQEFPNIIIPVATGDICLLNGNLAHAVLRGDPNVSSKKRLLVTFFMTLNRNNELIWWT